MFLAKNTSKKTGRTYLHIVHSYRNNQGKTKRKVIESLGYVDELQKKFDDLVAHFHRKPSKWRLSAKKVNSLR